MKILFIRPDQKAIRTIQTFNHINGGSLYKTVEFKQDDLKMKLLVLFVAAVFAMSTTVMVLAVDKAAEKSANVKAVAAERAGVVRDEA
jgi:hypothetical protein